MKFFIVINLLLNVQHLFGQFTYQGVDINPLGSSNPTAMMELDGKLFFAANNGSNGVEPWISDGTVSGTFMLKDITAGIDSSKNINAAFVFKNKLYFTFYNNSGTSMWRTDGTINGTVFVKSINSSGGNSSGFIQKIKVFDNFVIYQANDGVKGYETWITSATGLTGLLKEINVGPNSTNTTEFFQFKGKVYFTANDAVSYALWSTDGTAAGTVKVKDGINNLFGVGEINGQLLFKGSTAVEGQELFITDGTAAGTKIIKDFNTGIGMGLLLLSSGLIFENKFYYNAFDGTSWGLAVSDGTAAGTKFVKVMNDVDDRSFFILKGKMYIPRSNSGDLELWTSNGTTAGTSLITTINGAEFVNNIVFINNDKIFFYAAKAFFVSYPYIFDGTAAGTLRLKSNLENLTRLSSKFGNKATFTALIAGSGNEQLYLTDGSDANTIKLIPPTATNQNPCSGSTGINIRNKIFLVANYNNIFKELWIVTDTTMSATPLKTITSANATYSIFPNPASDFVKIISSNNIKCDMYDVTGKFIGAKILHVGENKIELHEQTEGIYYMHIDGQIEKIIVCR